MVIIKNNLFILLIVVVYNSQYYIMIYNKITCTVHRIIMTNKSTRLHILGSSSRLDTPRIHLVFSKGIIQLR